MGIHPVKVHAIKAGQIRFLLFCVMRVRSEFTDSVHCGKIEVDEDKVTKYESEFQGLIEALCAVLGTDPLEETKKFIRENRKAEGK